MHSSTSDSTRGRPYYGWVILPLAALAMLATLPGRTVGLGLITEPLLQDLELDRVAYGRMTFWATLIGASFCLLCGPLVDRFGIRSVVVAVLTGLGVCVLALTRVEQIWAVAVLLTLCRGFGQSALSAVSITMVGKWFVRRLALAMGIFSAAIGVLFAAAILLSRGMVADLGWRPAWSLLAWCLLGLAGLSLLLVRNGPPPDALGVEQPKTESEDPENGAGRGGFTLLTAMATPAFWMLALGSALYNLVFSGVVLWNESILAELGFGADVFEKAMAGFMGLGLLGNLVAGWLAQRMSLGRMLALALAGVCACLVTYPHLRSTPQVVAHAMTLGLAGGFVVVVFFTAFGRCFGRPHLGKIQGSVQGLTVLASASGPWLLARIWDHSGSYMPAFHGLAPVLGILAIAAWCVRLPRPEDAPVADAIDSKTVNEGTAG